MLKDWYQQPWGSFKYYVNRMMNSFASPARCKQKTVRQLMIHWRKNFLSYMQGHLARLFGIHYSKTLIPRHHIPRLTWANVVSVFCCSFKCPSNLWNHVWLTDYVGANVIFEQLFVDKKALKPFSGNLLKTHVFISLKSFDKYLHKNSKVGWRLAVDLKKIV